MIKGRPAAHAILAFVAAVGMALQPARAPAQTYPSKSVRLVAGFAPGGPVDTVARVVAQRLPAYLGQSVVVENRPGADATIAMELVAKSAPDGHTLYLIQPGVAINPALYRSVPFDPVKDFTPITLIGESPNLVAIHPSLPAKSLKELIALARGRPNQLFYGATSSPTLLATELMSSMASIHITRVSYKGAAPAFTALISGEVQLVISGIGTLLPLAKAGKVRGIAVTSARRTTLARDIPTVAEAGLPGYVATTWYGIAAPGATPRNIVDRINADMRKVLAEPEIRALLQAQGIDEPSPSTPEQLAELIRSEIAKWERVVKVAGVKME